MYIVDNKSYRSIKSFNKRVRFLVMHYTACNFQASVNTLAGNGAMSAHYLIPDPADRTYIDAGHKEVKIFNLVDENDRAWHAGVSQWKDRTNLNDTAIGIENVNLATENNGVFTFPPYHPDQIAALKELAKNIIGRYPDIEPTNVVAHSDISVGRKSDPGPMFPWKELYDEGIGAWYDEDTKNKYQQNFAAQGIPGKSDLLEKFKKYGYQVNIAQTDRDYKNLVRAFQLHFRQSDYSGAMDVETAAILCALSDKYVKK